LIYWEGNVDNLPYLLSAYVVFWALTFVLVFSIWIRQRRLEREIRALAARFGEEEADERNSNVV
jgi:uncharacterized membrane protein